MENGEFKNGGGGAAPDSGYGGSGGGGGSFRWRRHRLMEATQQLAGSQ